jgi:hypothetical protein
MKPAMDCREARAHAPLFVGEDLESDALEAVRGHLEACAECAAQVAALERALRAFEVERTRVDARVDLWSNIERELAQSGHLRPAQAAPSSLVSASAESAAGPAAGPSTASTRTSVAPAARATNAAALPSRRVLAGARRWFAVAAAAVLGAFVLNAWFEREPGRSFAPSDVQRGSVVVRETAPKSSAVSGAVRPSAEAASALVADGVNRPSAAEGQRFRLAAGPAVAPSVTPSVTPALAEAGSGAPASGPAPTRQEGLRRVNGDEALLRESLERWGVQGMPAGYSLVGYPVMR